MGTGKCRVKDVLTYQTKFVAETTKRFLGPFVRATGWLICPIRLRGYGSWLGGCKIVHWRGIIVVYVVIVTVGTVAIAFLV